MQNCKNSNFEMKVVETGQAVLRFCDFIYLFSSFESAAQPQRWSDICSGDSCSGDDISDNKELEWGQWLAFWFGVG